LTQEDVFQRVHAHFVHILRLIEGDSHREMDISKEASDNHSTLPLSQMSKEALILALSALACNLKVSSEDERIIRALEQFSLDQRPKNGPRIELRGEPPPPLPSSCLAPVVQGLVEAIRTDMWMSAPSVAGTMLKSKKHDFISVQRQFSSLKQKNKSQFYSLDFQRLRRFLDIFSEKNKE